jgi:hypothetical protein
VNSLQSEALLDGKRKTITALFADIKGSMQLLEGLDPEEARNNIDPALQLMMNAVRHYVGFIASTGDGIFALSGAPVAHEDHAPRAFYAALRLQEVMRYYAARLQTLARTGSIAVTDATRRLCEGYFLFKDLGPTRVKGVNEPVTIFEVTGLGPLRTRLQGAVGRGLTKFIGRQRELEKLKQVAAQAKAGHGELAAVVGEAGVGKSRLLHEFTAIAQTGCLLLETFSVSHGKASAHLPAIELLHGYFDIHPEDDPRKTAPEGRWQSPDAGSCTGGYAAVSFCPAGLGRRRAPARSAGGAAAAPAHDGGHQATAAARIGEPAIATDLRGSPLGRRGDSGATRPAGRRARHGEDSPAGQLSARIHASPGQKDLLHAGAARSAGPRERGGDAGRAARRGGGFGAAQAADHRADPGQSVLHGRDRAEPVRAGSAGARGIARGDALATVERALQAYPDELVFRPENLRRRGELRLTQGQTRLAEADFREAITLAHRMGANALQLRATVSLARLLAQHGPHDAARIMLADIYDSFTEGFDTVDLKEAQALLDELR